eukprot:15446528-Alexandrium_andersonii.AAC.1
MELIAGPFLGHARDELTPRELLHPGRAARAEATELPSLVLRPGPIELAGPSHPTGATWTRRPGRAAC